MPPGSLTVDPSDASYGAGGDCLGDGATGCAITDFTPVGSKPAGDGRWGQSDLGGELFSWLLDTAPGGSGWVDPCVDCAELTPSSNRVAHGGSYRDDSGNMRLIARSAFAPYVRADVFGFRCARP